MKNLYAIQIGILLRGMVEKNTRATVDNCPVCGKSCALELDSNDNKIAYATCRLCKTKWRRREWPEASEKIIYEKWVYHKGSELTIPFPGVGGGVKRDFGGGGKWEKASKPFEPVATKKPAKNRIGGKPSLIIVVSITIFVVALSLFLSGGFHLNGGPSATPAPTFSGTVTSNPTSNPSIQGVIGFSPKGIARIQLNDGTTLTVPANCFTFVRYNCLINGLLDNNSKTVPFTEMKSFSVYQSSILATMTDNEIKNLTNSNYFYSYDHLSSTFMAPTSSGVKNWDVNEVKKVDFDFSSAWTQSLSLATVTTSTGERFKAPAALMLFAQTSAGMGPSYSLHLGLNTEIGTVLPFSQIKRFELTTTGYKPSVAITTKDGQTLNTVMSGDTYFYSYFYGINSFGIFKLSMENDLKSIDFS